SLPATLTVNSDRINFTASQGGANVSQTLQVLNAGSESVAFTASATVSTPPGGSWLTISPAGGTAPAASLASLPVTAAPGTPAPGTYSGAIAITGAGKTISIPVTLSIGGTAPAILLSQSAMSFVAVEKAG